MLDKMRVCKAANFIEDSCKQREYIELENEKRYSHGEILNKLTEWYYYEDSEILNLVCELKTEIHENKYVAQNYQNIIKALVDLKSAKICDSELSEISAILLDKIKNHTETIEIENFQFLFSDKEMYDEFHKFYDPIYDLISQKNRICDSVKVNYFIEKNDVNQFTDYCKNNHNLFLQKKSFINYIELELFITFFKASSLPNIYQIIQAFQNVYNFSNLNEFYKDDLDKLNELKDRINELDWSSITRIRAKNCFCTILSDIIRRIKCGDKPDLHS